VCTLYIIIRYRDIWHTFHTGRYRVGILYIKPTNYNPLPGDSWCCKRAVFLYTYSLGIRRVVVIIYYAPAKRSGPQTAIKHEIPINWLAACVVCTPRENRNIYNIRACIKIILFMLEVYILMVYAKIQFHYRYYHAAFVGSSLPDNKLLQKRHNCWIYEVFF